MMGVPMRPKKSDVEWLFLLQKKGLRIGKIPVNFIHHKGSSLKIVPPSIKMLCDLFRIRYRFLVPGYDDHHGHRNRADLKTPGDYQYRALTAGHPVQRFWHKNKIAVVLEGIGIEKEEVVGDGGCDSGNLILEIGGRGKIRIGVDTNYESVAFARRLCESRGVRAHFVVASAEAMPFKEETFNQLFCLEMIEHLDPPAAGSMPKQLWRLLKNGGNLVVTTPNSWSA